MKVIYSIASAAIVFSLFYLLGAFYFISFNIGEWSDGARFVCTFIGGIASIISGGAVITAPENYKRFM